jgi:hypothetical protein
VDLYPRAKLKDTKGPRVVNIDGANEIQGLARRDVWDMPDEWGSALARNSNKRLSLEQLRGDTELRRRHIPKCTDFRCTLWIEEQVARWIRLMQPWVAATGADRTSREQECQEAERSCLAHQSLDRVDAG